MADIHGFCDDKFAPVRDELARSIDEGQDLGASFAVTIDGEMVVDIWGGHVDEQKTQPWQSDTIVNVYSSTKTMSFLCALGTGRSRSTGFRCQCRRLLAGVRTKR
jgi:CubicO group peptidase (beta-lactamase class C family)